MKIWTDVALDGPSLGWLQAQVAPHELVVAEPDTPVYLAGDRPDLACRTADIAFGQPSVSDVIESETLKWIHITSAGYTRLDRDDVRAALAARGCVMTNSSSVYADPCAQHVLALMLAHNRRIYSSLCKKTWTYGELRPTMRILRGDKVLILGHGAIARRLIALLDPFGVEIRTYRRNPKSDARDDLPWAEWVINTLPLSDATTGIVSRKWFEWMRPGSVFVNIGRGDTVDQAALIDALRIGHLSAAYLDVVTPEPLPDDHPLWSVPNCFITPHVGGGQQDERTAVLDHFVGNLRRFSHGEPLSDAVR